MSQNRLQNDFFNEEEKAILVAANPINMKDDILKEHLSELEMLAETAGATAVLKIIQDRNRIDSAYYIGKGKAEEIAELADLNDVNVIIFDDDLNPTQVRNLEKMINRKIVDRSGLILDIFAAHARTTESKTQVELAQLQYMLPRLTRAWTHLSKQFGGIGTKGPGETQIETDRRIIRTRISKLKEKLKKLESQQLTKSVQRSNFTKATLVGYTNAGKSTLLNVLTKADVLTEDKLFATLDSTTRRLQLNKDNIMLLSDTVGFIRKLPHNLIASFKSTLNVVKQADIVIHVIDISNPYFEDHIRVVEDTLRQLDCQGKYQLKVFNKADLLNDKYKIDYVKNKYPDSIVISAGRGINIGALKRKLLAVYKNNFIVESIKLRISDSKIVAQIHSIADVLSIKYLDEEVKITYRVSENNSKRIKRILSKRENILS
jgi:GTP-binding protein HflX